MTLKQGILRKLMTTSERTRFLQTLGEYYAAHGRHDLPWRLAEADGSFNAYKIMVSELMLQQTQVPRVIPKFQAFLQQFPTIQALADASLGEVLVAWQGLGYNRRAKFLWQAAQKVVREFGGELPRDQKLLESLPGIGRNTAGAIMAYAFNEPAVFVETNVRTVYIHHFFKDRTHVADAEILPLLQETLLQLGKGSDWFTEGEFGFIPKRSDKKPAQRVSYRVFYWQLMDYGTYLKQTVGNLSRASKHYARQPAFHGSLRQVRGKVLRILADGPVLRQQLYEVIGDERLPDVLASLEREGLIYHRDAVYQLP